MCLFASTIRQLKSLISFKHGYMEREYNNVRKLVSVSVLTLSSYEKLLHLNSFIRSILTVGSIIRFSKNYPKEDIFIELTLPEA